MPRNGTTGVFTRVSNSFSDPVVGTTIDPTHASALFTDVDTGITGSVACPVSSTDNAITRFDGTTGKFVQNSTVTVDDAGVFAGANISGATSTLSNIALSSHATQAAYTFVGNNTSSAAAPTAVDIAALTTKASPAAGDYLIISDQAASGAWKKSTVSAVSVAGSVASLNGQTGALTLLVRPQGRLTLATGTPVMKSSQTAKTTVYFALYGGNMAPIYDGTNMVPTVITELSQATTDATKSPAAVIPNAIYPCYIWNDSSTIRLSRGDYWKMAATVTMTIASPCVVTYSGSDFPDGVPIVFTTTGALPTGLTAGTTYFVKRTGAIGTPTATFNVAATVGGSAINTSGSQSGTHTGTAADYTGAVALASSGNAEQQFVNGIPLNKNAVTNGPGASRGTYVGIVMSNSSSQIDYNLGSSASGGTAGFLGVWNAWNQVFTTATVIDSGVQYNYSSTTVRQARGSTGNQVGFIIGSVENGITYSYSCTNSLGATNGAQTNHGIGLDSITAFSRPTFYLRQNQATNAYEGGGPAHGTVPITSLSAGYHYIAALENNPSGLGTTTMDIRNDNTLDVGIWN